MFAIVQQICCVKPVVDVGLLSSVVPIGGYEMPEKIKKFHLCNNVDKFQYDRPFHRGTKVKDNEFKVRPQVGLSLKVIPARPSYTRKVFSPS